MKQLTALVLITAITWHIMAEAAIYISFKINQDYIEKYLCENRDNPESECHGCCQLKKQLQEQEEKKAEIPESQLKKVEIQYFPVSESTSKLYFVYLNQPFPGYFIPYRLSVISEIFHPPQKSFNNSII